jgi:CysZ protein
VIWQAPGGLIAGVSYPFRAVRVLLQMPRLWGYVVIPILLNLGIGAALYASILIPGLEGIDRLIVNLPTWLELLAWLLKAVLIAGLLLILGFLLLQVGGILGAPWYGSLSEELEAIRLQHRLPRITGLATPLVEIGRALTFELKKLLLLVGVGVPLLLLNLLPGLGTAIASGGSIALGIILVCLDFLDGPLERRRLSFRAKLNVIFRSFPASAGFGGVCLVLISLPLLNLIMVPICVIAGTLFFCDRLWPWFQPEASNPSECLEGTK